MSETSNTEFTFLFIVYICLHGLFEFVYMKLMASKFYTLAASVQQLEGVKSFTLIPYGVMAYIIFGLSFWVFILHDIVAQKTLNPLYVYSRTTLFALAVFGIYNLTNIILFQRYDMRIAIVDMIWGIVSLNALAFLFLRIALRPRSS